MFHRCWMYHPTKGAKLFETEEAFNAKGKGWHDSPVFPAAEPEPEPEPADDEKKADKKGK